jgi:hypothetical protein
MTRASKSSLQMALGCLLVGLLCGVDVCRRLLGLKEWGFPFAAGGAAMVTSLIFWRLLVVRCPSPTTARGLWAGLLSGVVAHPVCWYVVLLFWHIRAVFFSALPRPPERHVLLHVLTVGGLDMALALILSCYSLVLYGWITVPAGAILGAWVARRPTGPPL